MKQQKKIKEILERFEAALSFSQTRADVDQLRVDYLGRKSGLLNEILRSLKELPEADRKIIGPLANSARLQMEAQLSEKESTLTSSHGSVTDITLPGIVPQRGHLHPLTQVFTELTDIFVSMGFMVYEGPELESDYYNFEALNFPPSHPARDIQDTFFIKTPITRKEPHGVSKAHWLMRTQTSNMQVRLMEKYTPPFRSIILGRTFRNEATDASHEHTFHQLEGIVVGTDISVGNLTWALREIFRQLYRKDVKVRLRPGYFPFTEPSFEIDLSCVFCDQKGCRVCKHTGWVEMGGSGMTHPNVYKAAGYPAGKYTGFAFGMGPDRMAMLKYGIPDIRYFMESNVRFLHQF